MPDFPDIDACFVSLQLEFWVDLNAPMKPSQIVGVQRLAIHRGSSTTALFAAGWSEYSLTKLWPFGSMA
jgi:hypothetical protein